MSRRLVSDELWAVVEPLLPPRNVRPQGGGRAAVDDRAVFTAIVYVLTTGCAWRHLPPSFGVSVPTAHRRFTAWSRAGLWQRLHRVVLDAYGAAGEVDWSARRHRRCEPTSGKGGSLTGPNPTDRGKNGSKLHVLCDAAGLPLVVGVSAANTHDSLALRPLVQGIPPVRSRRGPRRRRPAVLHADKGYDYPIHRAWLRQRGITPRTTPRIARRGIDTNHHLGRHRWKIERTIAWLGGYRRLTTRYERHGHPFGAFLSLAAALVCWKKLAK
ncbi:MAG: IS5 family transposase [Angustibacter sp.]